MLRMLPGDESEQGVAKQQAADIPTAEDGCFFSSVKEMIVATDAKQQEVKVARDIFCPCLVGQHT